MATDPLPPHHPTIRHQTQKPTQPRNRTRFAATVPVSAPIFWNQQSLPTASSRRAIRLMQSRRTSAPLKPPSPNLSATQHLKPVSNAQTTTHKSPTTDSQAPFP